MCQRRDRKIQTKYIQSEYGKEEGKAELEPYRGGEKYKYSPRVIKLPLNKIQPSSAKHKRHRKKIYR